MPIIDYARYAQKIEQNFLANPALTPANLQSIREYLAQYHVNPATRTKFFRHIIFVLNEAPDFRKDMHDRSLMNQVFSRIREKQGDGYYGTVVNVSRALARWLNDGELPKGLKDVRPVSKKDQKRDLSSGDMWTWQDVLEFAKHSRSVQLNAALAVQVDAGMRPSEFIDLKYGDVSINKDIVIFRIRQGKTGSRDVPCNRSTPLFLRWYNDHPLKELSAPLWLMEFGQKSHTQSGKVQGWARYQYPALVKRIRFIALKADIQKPADFYNLRHSSCYLDKIDNLPVELAAERHGHTVEYFTNVYARMDTNDRVNRMRSHYKVASNNSDQQLLNRICARCEHINSPTSDTCYKCTAPLTLTKAMEMDKSNELQKQLQEQKSQIDKLQMVFLKTIASMNAQEAKNKIQPEIIKEFLAVDN